MGVLNEIISPWPESLAHVLVRPPLPRELHHIENASWSLTSTLSRAGLVSPPPMIRMLLHALVVVLCRSNRILGVRPVGGSLLDLTHRGLWWARPHRDLEPIREDNGILDVRPARPWWRRRRIARVPPKIRRFKIRAEGVLGKGSGSRCSSSGIRHSRSCGFNRRSGHRRSLGSRGGSFGSRCAALLRLLL